MAGERTPEEIQRDIESSRTQLAAAVDQLAYRGNPKRVVEKTRRTVIDKANTPQGRAVLGVVGGLVLLKVIKRIRNR